MAWMLTFHGREIERHPNRETCVVAAIERGWVFRFRHGLCLLEGVQVEQVGKLPGQGREGEAGPG